MHVDPAGPVIHAKLAGDGIVNVAVGFNAVSGPALVTPNVTANAPGVTPKCTGTVKLGSKSAPKLTRVITLEVNVLAGNVAVVVVTVAVFLNRTGVPGVKPVGGLPVNVTVAVNVSVVPTGNEPVAVHVFVTQLNASGPDVLTNEMVNPPVIDVVSFTFTPAAFDGPLLVNVIVYLAWPPPTVTSFAGGVANGLGDICVFKITGVALGVTATDT